MSKLNIIKVDENTIYTVVKENIYSCVDKPIDIEDIKFHHNLHIEAIPSALKYGLLSKEMKAKIIENRELTDYELYKFSDEHYVNGKDYISLASTIENLSMMYEDEILYNTYKTTLSSIIVSKSVRAGRNASNYFNEFLVQDIIPVELFNSIEIRLFKLFNEESSEDKTKKILEAYEALREIAVTLKQNNLDIPLRESSNVMCNEESNNAITLNPEKVIEMPKLILK